MRFRMLIPAVWGLRTTNSRGAFASMHTMESKKIQAMSLVSIKSHRARSSSRQFQTSNWTRCVSRCPISRSNTTTWTTPSIWRETPPNKALIPVIPNTHMSAKSPKRMWKPQWGIRWTGSTVLPRFCSLSENWWCQSNRWKMRSYSYLDTRISIWMMLSKFWRTAKKSTPVPYWALRSKHLSKNSQTLSWIPVCWLYQANWLLEIR